MLKVTPYEALRFTSIGPLLSETSTRVSDPLVLNRTSAGHPCKELSSKDFTVKFYAANEPHSFAIYSANGDWSLWGAL